MSDISIIHTRTEHTSFFITGFILSDISIVQSNPFNTTIHISLNVGMGCKVLLLSLLLLLSLFVSMTVTGYIFVGMTVSA